VWLATFLTGDQRAIVLGPIAIAAASSDIIDGSIARRTQSANEFGRWLDSAADIFFVLTALGCEAVVGNLPWYIPVLIAISFTQYVFDSVMIRRSAVPVRSRLGHWGGIVNFAMVIVLAFAPSPRWPGVLVRRIAPAIALFYLAAIAERAVGYRSGRRKSAPAELG
jgi:phosphatidylglycerophosphate synthase